MTGRELSLLIGSSSILSLVSFENLCQAEISQLYIEFFIYNNIRRFEIPVHYDFTAADIVEIVNGLSQLQRNIEFFRKNKWARSALEE